MIEFRDNVFYLSSDDTSYIFRITEFGHLEHIYYGSLLPDADISALYQKRTAVTGSSILYDESDDKYCLDIIPLEYSGIGKGDYRFSPAELKMPDGTFTCDFVYFSHNIESGCFTSEALPLAYGAENDCQRLEIILREKKLAVKLRMLYTVYPAANVITRRVILENSEEHPLVIRRLMSMMLDLPADDYCLLTLGGGWIKEAHICTRQLKSGMYINSSDTGASSNRANPGVMLYREGCREDSGEVYGFNLVYSGNHYEAVQINENGSTRVMCGINPECFEWELKQNESFETPEAVLTYSGEGFGKASRNFHDFINAHIVRGDWKGRPRPVLLNSWEACFFKFTQSRLLRLAKKGRALGIELFVLDDGWFGERNDDTAGLGDYRVNRKKLPNGLNGLARRLKRMGLGLGLWVEPEMVNENSELYRAHPDYAVKIPGRKPSYGRRQLVLDLCRPEVRDYITANLQKLLAENDITYIKWDMNRHISDAYSPALRLQGEFFHRYILGLYDILRRVFASRPDILLETCSSGGNRFDLGMLCFSPQIWASDDTDPAERLEIQKGLSYFYPLSSIGAHVSAAPHQQTLRDTPLSARFNTAAFGVLGYEMDLDFLSHAEKKEIKKQISFYKKYRQVFQYGSYFRGESDRKDIYTHSCIAREGREGTAAFYVTKNTASPNGDILKINGLKYDKIYDIAAFEQGTELSRFGGLINFLLPFKINPRGMIMNTVSKLYMLPGCAERFTASGALARAGIHLKDRFRGTGYSGDIRMLADWGSEMFTIKEKE